MGIRDRFRKKPEERSDTITLDQWLAEWMQYQGLGYPYAPQFTLGSQTEEIGGSFSGLVEGAYKANGVIFACMLVRQLLFSEARFQFRRIQNGRPGDYFGTQDLVPLEQPWPGGTTGDLLTRMIQDGDLAGNAYVRRSGTGLARLRPDWVTIVLGSKSLPENPRAAADVQVAGYLYHPGGRGGGEDPVPFLQDEVAHFAPIPDPNAAFRGMSWLTPVITEIMADNAATTHKQKFYDQGATVNLAITLDPAVDRETYQQWIELFRDQTEGAANAYKTLFLGGGADVKTVGSDLKQVDFKAVQGAGETRIAAAAGVPPVIVGLSEGLQAATYSNYSQARRRFADGTMRPLWRNASASLANIIQIPQGSELAVDTRDIAFLREDEADLATIHSTQATAIKSLTEAGFAPDSCVSAVVSGDLTQLQHTGLTSVQLLPPGSPKPTTNGAGTATPAMTP